VAVVEVEVTGDGGTILTKQVAMLSNMAAELGNPQLAREIESPRTRGILREYIDFK
jgi:hypothetical protein